MKNNKKREEYIWKGTLSTPLTITFPSYSNILSFHYLAFRLPKSVIWYFWQWIQVTTAFPGQFLKKKLLLQSLGNHTQRLQETGCLLTPEKHTESSQTPSNVGKLTAERSAAKKVSRDNMRNRVNLSWYYGDMEHL